MNFYPHHIKDFNNSTRHLTRVERSLYRDAIELYYDTETVLTNDFEKLSRKLLAISEEEKEALNTILHEFFIEYEYGFFHVRCDEELTKYRANISNKAKAGIASAEARRNKLTPVEHLLNINKTGVHNQEPITNNQEPRTKNQEPIKNSEVITIVEVSEIVSAEKTSAPHKKGKALASDWQLPKKWGEWALSERPEFTADEIRKVSESFKDYWRSTANQAKSKRADWEATWRNWVRNQKRANGYQSNSIAEQNKQSTELARQRLFGKINLEKEVHNAAETL